MDETLLRALEGYIGSVAGLGREQFVATSPRGNAAVVIDRVGNVLRTLKSYDVCGVATTISNETLMSNGGGAVAILSAESQTQVAKYNLAFDNHLVALKL